MNSLNNDTYKRVYVLMTVINFGHVSSTVSCWKFACPTVECSLQSLERLT